MATKKTAAKKPAAKKAWDAETIAEYKASAASIWRAQKATSPQGQEFLGIRRFRVDAEGEEQPDSRAGFQVKIEESGKVLAGLQKLMAKLVKAAEDTGSDDAEVDDSDADEEEDAKPAKKAAPAKKAVGKKYAIQTKSGKFFQIDDNDEVTLVKRIKDATMLTKAEAEAHLEEYENADDYTLVAG